MNTSDIIQKYFKLIKEEKHFNYKYNPILNSEKKTVLPNNKKFDIHLNNNNNNIKNIKILSSSEKKLNWINKKINSKNKKLEEIFTNPDNLIPKRMLSEIPQTKTQDNKIIKNLFINNLYSMTIPFKSKEMFKENNLGQYKTYRKKKKIKIKTFFIKRHCPCCQKILTEKEFNKNNNNNINTNLNNIYRNKKFKDIKSCFIYSVNNFPLISPKNINGSNKNYFKEKLYDEAKEKYMTTPKYKKKKINMESELSKSNKIIKIKENQRKEFDSSNLYLVKKPLIPSIRGKILKFTKKRIGRPMRMIFLDEKEYEDFFD